MGIGAEAGQVEALESAERAVDGSFDYVISGLTVRSEVELPSAIPAETPHTEPDTQIILGEVPELLENADRQGKAWALRGDQFLLKLRGLMRVLITGGRSIVVQPDQGNDPGELALFLLGTCFSILLHQRGRVVLHASAVAVGDRAMLFCGQSGAGKSTLAAMLGRRGHALLNDDVCNLSVEPDGSYVVYPDGRMLKLWAKSLEHLEWEGGLRVRSDMEKFYRQPDRVDLTPRRVGGVYALEALPDGADITLTRLPLAEATSSLIRNAYRPGLVQEMGMTNAYFEAAVAIQREAGVFRLARPMDFAHAEQVLDMLEAQWERVSMNCGAAPVESDILGGYEF